MSGKVSAGLLMFRRKEQLEVLLVHPGGPLWARKDAGAWSIPKGEYQPGDDPLQAARREFEEEIGIRPDGEFLLLTPVKQAGGKIVAAWALAGDVDTDTIRSNTFTMEWPPRSGTQKSFPEIDRAEWFRVEKAREKILSGQLPLLDELLRILETQEKHA